MDVEFEIFYEEVRADVDKHLTESAVSGDPVSAPLLVAKAAIEREVKAKEGEISIPLIAGLVKSLKVAVLSCPTGTQISAKLLAVGAACRDLGTEMAQKELEAKKAGEEARKSQEFAAVDVEQEKKEHAEAVKVKKKKGSRMEDGANKPTTVNDMVEFLPKGYTPEKGLEQCLMDLAPNQVEACFLTQMMKDFEIKEAENAKILAKTKDLAQNEKDLKLLDRTDRLALFAYSYEIKRLGSCRRRLSKMSGAQLAEEVREAAEKAGVAKEDLPENDLSTICELFNGLELLRATDGDLKGALETSSVPSDELIAALRKALDFTQTRDADDSLNWQIYWKMSAGMRAVCGATRTSNDSGEVRSKGRASSEAAKKARKESEKRRLAAKEKSKEFDPFRPILYYICKALDKLPKGQTTVYRGIGIPINKSDFTAGTSIVWSGFSSTSLDPEVGKDFLSSKGDNPGVLFIITSQNGRDISLCSMYPGEKELLIPPNAAFRVKGVAPKGIKKLLKVSDQVNVIEMSELCPEEIYAEKLWYKATLLRAAGLWRGGEAVGIREKLTSPEYSRFSTARRAEVQGLLIQLIDAKAEKDAKKTVELQSKIHKQMTSTILKYPTSIEGLVQGASFALQMQNTHLASYFVSAGMKLDPDDPQLMFISLQIHCINKDQKSITNLSKEYAASHVKLVTRMFNYGNLDGALSMCLRALMVNLEHPELKQLSWSLMGTWRDKRKQDKKRWEESKNGNASENSDAEGDGEYSSDDDVAKATMDKAIEIKEGDKPGEEDEQNPETEDGPGEEGEAEDQEGEDEEVDNYRWWETDYDIDPWDSWSALKPSIQRILMFQFWFGLWTPEVAFLRNSWKKENKQWFGQSSGRWKKFQALVKEKGKSSAKTA